MSSTKSKFIKGVMAGCVATAVLTRLMMIKRRMGVMTELDPVHMFSEMAVQQVGMAPNIMVG